MSAYVNGAVSALERAIKSIDELDPEGKNWVLQDLKEEYKIFIDMYKLMDKGPDAQLKVTEALEKFDQFGKDDDPAHKA